MKAKDLRNSILQLAVQGKLVEQDPADEPASVLLEKIRVERARLIKEEKIKAPKGGESIIFRGSDGKHYEKRINAKGHESEPVCIEDEIPFEIPECWEWARLGSVCNYGQCTNIEYADIEDGTWVLELEQIEKDTGRLTGKIRKKGGKGSTKHSFKKGDVLYSKLRPYLNKVVIADEAGAATSEIFPLDFLNLIDARFAQYFLMSPVFVDYAKACSYGVKMPRLGTVDGQLALMPIPPKLEQEGIVSKLDDLKPIVSQYNTFETAREKLDSELPDKLRKSIFQIAVQGKLVSQDPNDEPASVLLERIREQRRQLITEGKMKPPKGGESVIYRTSDGSYYEKHIDAKGRESDPVCIDDEIPFAIPESWAWMRLGSLLEIERGGSPRPIKEYLTESPDGINWIKIGDTQQGGKYIYSTQEKIKPEGMKKSRYVIEGDFLLTNSMSFGRPYILKTEGCIHDGWLVIRKPEFIYNKDFLYYLLSSPMMFSQFSMSAAGSTVKNLNIDKVKNSLVPVPPAKEQERILSKLHDFITKLR